jgi:NAD(P)-dependent dehydrogenase (short-subunit alcohol dehydrogenase family)
MPNVRTILITGSTDGLGRQTARELARSGQEVIVHGRDEARVRSTVDWIRAETGGERPHSYVADLSSLAEVRRLAQHVEAGEDRLDVLVNNAGLIPPRGAGRQLSRDGYELTFAVNYLSHFLLTLLLLGLLERSAPARIVNVASIGQHEIDFDDVMLERGYTPYRAYAQSKLAQIMFTFELAERLPDARVMVNALHPATLMDTKMVRESFGRSMTSVREGVEATIRLIGSPELEGVTGRFFDGHREARAHDQAYDREARRRLWELSERLCGLQTGPSGSTRPGSKIQTLRGLPTKSTSLNERAR